MSMFTAELSWQLSIKPLLPSFAHHFSVPHILTSLTHSFHKIPMSLNLSSNPSACCCIICQYFGVVCLSQPSPVHLSFHLQHKSCGSFLSVIYSYFKYWRRQRVFHICFRQLINRPHLQCQELRTWLSSMKAYHCN